MGAAVGSRAWRPPGLLRPPSRLRPAPPHSSSHRLFQDADVDAVVNMLLSECAWGRLEAGPLWVPVGRLAADRPAADPQLMTYRSFLDSFLLPSDPGKDPVANDVARRERQALKRRFTAPGEPGELFRSVFDRLVAVLSKASAPGRRILPSFYNLLLHLQAQAGVCLGCGAGFWVRQLWVECPGAPPGPATLTSSHPWRAFLVCRLETLPSFSGPLVPTWAPCWTRWTCLHAVPTPTTRPPAWTGRTVVPTCG